MERLDLVGSIVGWRVDRNQEVLAYFLLCCWDIKCYIALTYRKAFLIKKVKTAGCDIDAVAAEGIVASMQC